MNLKNFESKSINFLIFGLIYCLLHYVLFKPEKKPRYDKRKKNQWKGMASLRNWKTKNGIFYILANTIFQVTPEFCIFSISIPIVIALGIYILLLVVVVLLLLLSWLLWKTKSLVYIVKKNQWPLFRFRGKYKEGPQVFSFFLFTLNYLFFSRVFVNRSLSLDNINYFGFDMDYTLAGEFPECFKKSCSVF